MADNGGGDAFDLVIIGSGPGGYVAAIRAAQLGLNTAVIEEDKIGGVCLNVGCIPSKSLIYASGLVEKIRHADTMGLTVGDVSVDGTKLQAWKNGIVNRLTTGVGFLLSKNGATTIHGHAEFTGPNSLVVSSGDGKTRDIRFQKCIVATGARAAALPFLPLEDRKVIDYRGGLDIDWVPETFTVIGGGVIGLELGGVFQRFGSKLTVVELTDSLLPGTDPELVKVVERSMKKAGAKIHKSTSATGKKVKGGKQYLLAKDAKGKELEIESEVILVAVGFKPNSDRVGAAKAGLQIDDTGHFPVNEHRQTNVPHIYAIGDVAGLPWLAHKASKEGIVAAEHAAGQPSAYDVRAMPAATFTEPEIATVGVQEHEAKAQGLKVKVGKFPFTALGRALSVNATTGMVKMIADAETDEVLGVSAVGYQASDLIAEAALAIEMGATSEDIALTVHAHPTWPESMMEAAEAVHKQAIHILNA